MAKNTIALNHSCNVVSREIEEEFKDLRLFFVVHEKDKLEEALKKSRKRIANLPGGEIALNYFDTNKVQNASEFIGLSTGRKSNLLKIFRNNKYLGIFFVDADSFLVEENATHYLYHLAWHALDLMQKHKEDPESCREYEGFIFPKDTRLSISLKNMMADVFGAILMEAKNHEDYILTLANKRVSETLKPTPRFNAEYFPYAIAYEACQIVYDDLKDANNSRTRPIHQALDLANEVSLTYGETSVKQWWAFSGPAQEMAWMGYTPQEVLGTALYTSEDPYVRATAHLISEITDIKPKILTSLAGHNPFAHDEANKRLHGKLLDETFQKLISKVLIDSDTLPFYKEINKQNKELLSGRPMGWCAYALLESALFIEKVNEGQNSLESVGEIFQKCQKETPWDIMTAVSKLIMKLRRQGHDVKAEHIEKAMHKAEKLKPVRDVLMSGLTKERIQGAKQPEHGVEQYLNDSYVKQTENKIQYYDSERKED